MVRRMALHKLLLSISDKIGVKYATLQKIHSGATKNLDKMAVGNRDKIVEYYNEVYPDLDHMEVKDWSLTRGRPTKRESDSV